MNEYLIIANNQNTGKARLVRRGLNRSNVKSAQRAAFKNRNNGEIVNSYSMGDFNYCYTTKQVKQLLSGRMLNYNA